MQKVYVMGFAVWIDEELQVCWAQGTHEYRPMGAAVTARLDQFAARDFSQEKRPPQALANRFVGFFGSLETVNEYLRSAKTPRFRRTPAHLL
jgi:hypothetical protein